MKKSGCYHKKETLRSVPLPSSVVFPDLPRSGEVVLVIVKKNDLELQ